LEEYKLEAANSWGSSSDTFRRQKEYFEQLNNADGLASLFDLHKGKRAFVLGNGPSLKIDDLNLLQNEITFASNKIYLAFNETSYRPTYWTICDALVAENCFDEIRTLKLIKIGAWSTKSYLKGIDSMFFSNAPRGINRDIYTWDLVKGIYAGHSVVNFSLKLAYWMGIREIYVIGVDFKFTVPKTVTGIKIFGNDVIISQGEVNHFHSDYRKSGESWTMPQLEAQRKDFQMTGEFYKQNDGIVYNASRCSELDVWERVEFDTFFSPVTFFNV
jgi:hypothetical protein